MKKNVVHFVHLLFREMMRRKNLLREFKKFKKRKQRLWNIVVTERAKKEMADQEAERGKR